MKQILCLSHTPWQASPNRTQQLLSRMPDVQVLFFEPAPRGTARPEQGRRMRSHITVYTLPAALPADAPRRLAHRRSINKSAAFIRGMMDKHHFRNPVLWCTAPDQAALLGVIPCRGVVYDCHKEWPETYLDQESDLTSRADVVFAASPGLVERLSPCSDNIALLPNGVNPLMFDRGEFSPPDRLAALAGRPVLGRVGDLTGQTDLRPLLAAATAQRDWTFLLIGRFTRQVSDMLSRYPNIILNGPVNAVELPDYLSVCTVLFDLIQEDQRGCDILSSRIYEYLATGKPIVMMAEPDYVEPFPDAIYTAYDHTGFLRRCRKAMEEDAGTLSSQRRAYADQSAWSVRGAEVLRILESTGLF